MSVTIFLKCLKHIQTGNWECECLLGFLSLRSLRSLHSLRSLRSLAKHLTFLITRLAYSGRYPHYVELDTAFHLNYGYHSTTAGVYKEKKPSALPPRPHRQEECRKSTPLAFPRLFHVNFYCGGRAGPFGGGRKSHHQKALTPARAPPLRHGSCRKKQEPRPAPPAPTVTLTARIRFKQKPVFRLFPNFYFVPPVKRSTAGAGLRQLPAFRMDFRILPRLSRPRQPNRSLC